ncbi:MAG TPA: type VI secretion system tip protein TssI/VgrG [Bryobacteraceae bacterium]|nr:type VI secretion system tip protein TssI/VgrG [Bryobacteraceae bacterium]
MAALSQNKRLFYIDTPLGKDKLLVRKLHGREAMSEAFFFSVDAVSEDPRLNITELVGKQITVAVRQSDESSLRYFNGYVRRAKNLPPVGYLFQYRLEVVPWLWLLTRTADCYIHQNKTVPEVVEWVFKKFGFTDYRLELRNSSNYGPWVYLTQYRETAFEFVNRLLEIEGIFYFFEQKQGKHTMVIADAPAAHQPCPHQARVKLERAFGRGYNRTEDTVFSWDVEKNVRSGKYSHRDFNFEKPDADMHSEVPARSRRTGNDNFEVYDYPGEFEEHGEGSAWVRLRMEEEETDEEFARGTSCARSLMPGFKFDLTGHERRDQNRSYVVTEVVHSGEEENLLPEDQGRPARYTNSFRCIPFDIPYRAARKTPKHIMRGVQTATVVGKKGEEITCDKYGRVKVQFHWDRVGKKDEGSSCWIRVSQPWAGQNYGGMWLPRIGQEVIIDFIEGDPDRPIITGRVYNANQMPAWKLPDKQNWSGFKTRSTKGGGQDNANELRFDDTKGEENIVLHAEKDLEISVEKETVFETGTDHHFYVGNDHLEEIKKNHDATIGENCVITVGKEISISSGTSTSISVGTDAALEAGQEIHIKGGMKVVIEAGMQLSLKGPGGFVDIGPAGVTIQGTLVQINSGGSAGSGSGVKKKTAKKPKKAEKYKK